MSISPASTSQSSRLSAGRFSVPPEIPPSSKWSGSAIQPSLFWLTM
jgi:hypothetical protein